MKLTLEQGIVQTLELIKPVQRPTFVGVFGYPNSGKTYFARQLGRCASKHGLTAINYTQKEHNVHIPEVDIIMTEYIGPFHPLVMDMLDREMVQKHGKTNAVKVLIYKPNNHYSVVHARDAELFDLIVRNPDAITKQPKPL